MTVDSTARAEVILEEPEEDEAFGKDDEEEEDDEDDSEGEFKKERITSFEERMLAANPEAIAPIQLQPCDSCGRKFNLEALQRHIKVCEKTKSKPRKIFDAVHKLWKTDAEVEKSRLERRSSERRKKSSLKGEESYKPCDFCGRKFCENAFERHVEWCRTKSSRLQASPTKDEQALAKLAARVKYNPQEVARNSRRSSCSPSRKASNTSLFSEASLPPWNIGSPFSPCMSPVSSNMLARAEGNQRASKNTSSARMTSAGSKSLSRASAGAFLRQGDAGLSPPPGFSREWDPELDAKAPTLSRSQSGRGSIKKPALTKAALMRLAAGEKKVEEEERRRQKSEFGISFDSLRSRAVTPSNNNLMTRSAYGASSLAGEASAHLQPDVRRCRTPQLGRRRTNSRRREELENSNGMENRFNLSNSMNNNNNANQHQPTSSWKSFQPVMGRQSTFHPAHHLQSPPPMDRAEPDGIEDDADSPAASVAKSLEGDYDHSKEYDPFKTAERQMQELLFGTPTATKPSPRYGAPGMTHQTVQKPQPVRPNPSNSTLYNLKTTTRGLVSDHPSISDGPINQRPQRGHPHIKPTRPNLRQQGSARMCKSPENEEIASCEKKSNWRQFLPALLSRQQTNNSRQQTNKARQQTNNNSKQQAHNSRPEKFTAASSTNKQTSPGLARFCHSCGSPFPMPHVRFCCQCGTKRLQS